MLFILQYNYIHTALCVYMLVTHLTSLSSESCLSASKGRGLVSRWLQFSTSPLVATKIDTMDFKLFFNYLLLFSFL